MSQEIQCLTGYTRTHRNASVFHQLFDVIDDSRRAFFLEQVSAGAGLQGALDAVVAVKGGQRDDPDAGGNPGQLLGGPDAVHDGHEHVEDDDARRRMIDQVRDELLIGPDELKLLIRSALTQEQETDYWFERVVELGDDKGEFLAQLMRERLGVPVYVDNDANVACYGEFWLGAGRNVDSMVLLTLGTGVGGGIVVMGQLLRGPDGTAGEIGHLCVKRDGRQCNCGAKGCLEQYASVSGMLKTARKRIEQGGLDTALIRMCGGNLDNLTGKMVSDAVEQGDTFAKWVMEETGRWLGTGIGSIINLLNPEMVVLGGGMIGAGDVLFNPVRETARAQSFDVPGKRAEIIPAALGGDAGVIGAAGCALNRVEQDARRGK